ncbi:MAG: XapX domain-containing protein [Ectobacillus sp.]
MEILLSLLAGLIVGVLFSFAKLPIPAPPTLSGILGIIGVYAGYQLVLFFKGM